MRMRGAAAEEGRKEGRRACCMLAMGKVLCRGTKHLGCGLQRGMNVSEYKLLTERERKKGRDQKRSMTFVPWLAI